MKSISGNKIKKIVNGIKKTANEKNEITTYLACKRRQTNGLGNLRDAIERKKDFLMTVTVIENKVWITNLGHAVPFILDSSFFIFVLLFVKKSKLDMVFGTNAPQIWWIGHFHRWRKHVYQPGRPIQYGKNVVMWQTHWPMCEWVWFWFIGSFW